jgi:hypothetical protein
MFFSVVDVLPHFGLPHFTQKLLRGSEACCLFCRDLNCFCLGSELCLKGVVTHRQMQNLGEHILVEWPYSTAFEGVSNFSTEAT